MQELDLCKLGEVLYTQANQLSEVVQWLQMGTEVNKAKAQRMITYISGYLIGVSDVLMTYSKNERAHESE